MRLNLQLFATLNTSTSIVDYLKSQGQDSSYSARKKLASQYGISNYSGTASQNVALLKAVKSGSSASSKSNSNSGTSNNTSITAINGVDQALVNKINSSYTQSSEVTNAKNEASSLLNSYKELASKPFQESQAYQEAMAYTNQLLQQLSSGRTSYTDQIKDLMGQIQNRDKFEYDMESDTLFQQALASAMGSGKQAMQDTIGQASALTGGYGSTYATSAGNQAYNSFIEDAYDNLPEYYQMALEAYQMEGQEMYNQLAMLNDADAAEYQRMYDSWSANFSNAQQIYQQDYTQWQDSINNAYNVYSAVQGNADTMYAQEYQKWADEVANAMSYANMQNTDYWNNQNFIESQRQYNETLAMQKSQFAQEMAYKQQALAQDNAQFYASLNAQQSKSSKSGSKSGSGSDDELKQPTETQMKRALEAYNSGGDAALDKYVDSLGSNIDMTSIASYIDNYGELPLSKRTFTVIDDGGTNWFGGVDGNAKVKDQYGNTYKLSDLKKEDKTLATALSKLKKGQSYTAK